MIRLINYLSVYIQIKYFQVPTYIFVLSSFLNEFIITSLPTRIPWSADTS